MIKTQETWMLMMELLEDHMGIGPAEIVREKDADYWWKTINNLSAVPIGTLVKDRERLRLAIYACCFIHWHDLGTGSDAETRNPAPVSNPGYDPYVENVAQDGRHWGMRLERENLPMTHLDPVPYVEPPQSVDPLGHTFVDDGTLPNPFEESRQKLLNDTRLSDRGVTVREQVEEKKEEQLADFKETQVSGEELAKVHAQAASVYKQKWGIAEKLARKPKEAWQNAPYELVKMVEFCYGWIRDTGEVPAYPDSIIEIWRDRPTWQNTNMTPEAVTRRNEIVEKVYAFWTKSVEESKDTINLRSESYRVTLGVMELEKAIEGYANGTVEAGHVRGCAVRYFHAHFPIEQLGVKPGPIDTLDPDYIKYLGLCKKYNLEVGTLLHEANL
jgi:hypothetical protein